MFVLAVAGMKKVSFMRWQHNHSLISEKKPLYFDFKRCSVALSMWQINLLYVT